MGYLTKKQAVWICRKMIKIWHPELRGDTSGKQEYWIKFLDILYKDGRIEQHDYETWLCPFKQR
jgi:hypothetical protein